MTIIGGPHVSIDGVKYLLAQGLVDRPYAHNYDPIADTTDAGTTRSDLKELIPSLNYWTTDDWSGGEGYEFFRSDDPIVYYQGLINSRIAHKLKPPPAATNSTMPTDPTASGGGAFSAIGDSAVWVCSNKKTWR